MFAHDIKIAGVTLPFDAAWQLSQTYETLGGRALLRTLNGTGVLQSHWSKVRTVIRGQGRYPDALSAVNWAASVSIECAAPLGIHSAGTAVTLPAARRTDWAPFAQAVVDGRTVMPAHGTREMPAWGAVFAIEAGDRFGPHGAETFIRGRIVELVTHIETLQR